MKVRTKIKAGVLPSPAPEATRSGDVRGNNNNASVNGFVKARGRTLRLKAR